MGMDTTTVDITIIITIIMEMDIMTTIIIMKAIMKGENIMRAMGALAARMAAEGVAITTNTIYQK